MGWIVGTVLMLLCAGIAFIVARNSSKGTDARVIGSAVSALLALGWVILTVVSMVNIIPAGHVGVVYGFGGGSITGHLDSGTKFVAPWREVKVASVQLKSVIFDYTGDNAAVSNDQQAVYAKVQVNYQLDPNHVVDLYKNVGPNWFNVLMEGRVAQDFKQVTSSFATKDITTQRPLLRQKTLTAIRGELEKYSVTIGDVQIKNLHFSQRYTDAITDKQVAYQKAQAAVQNANAAVNTARGEATSTLVKAEAQAKANKLLSVSLTPNVIAYQYVQKIAPTITTQLVPANAIIGFPGSLVGKTPANGGK